MTEVLRVEDLRVRYRTRLGDIRAVNGVNFALQESSIMCLVGESGSGKSTVALAMMGLLPHNGDVVEGKVLFQSKTCCASPLAGYAAFVARTSPWCSKSPSRRSTQFSPSATN